MNTLVPPLGLAGPTFFLRIRLLSNNAHNCGHRGLTPRGALPLYGGADPIHSRMIYLQSPHSIHSRMIYLQSPNPQLNDLLAVTKFQPQQNDLLAVTTFHPQQNDLLAVTRFHPQQNVLLAVITFHPHPQRERPPVRAWNTSCWFV